MYRMEEEAGEIGKTQGDTVLRGGAASLPAPV